MPIISSSIYKETYSNSYKPIIRIITILQHFLSYRNLCKSHKRAPKHQCVYIYTGVKGSENVRNLDLMSHHARHGVINQDDSWYFTTIIKCHDIFSLIYHSQSKQFLTSGIKITIISTYVHWRVLLASKSSPCYYGSLIAKPLSQFFTSGLKTCISRIENRVLIYTIVNFDNDTN